MFEDQDRDGCESGSEEVAAARRGAIEQAAIGEFSRRGFSATSMAHIAEAAGMSRPALYQYFRNKGDIFASAMTAVLEGAVDGSLAALDAPGPVSDQLDSFLQRFDGDLWETTNASPLGDELMSAKADHAPKAFATATERLAAGLLNHLEAIEAGGSGSAGDGRRSQWVELLRLAPKGLKYDEPSIEVLRGRLAALARSVAADIEAAGYTPSVEPSA
jgi:AcrR family transcriptional regulator